MVYSKLVDSFLPGGFLKIHDSLLPFWFLFCCGSFCTRGFLGTHESLWFFWFLEILYLLI